MPRKSGNAYRGQALTAAVLVGIVGVVGGIAYGAYVALPYILGPAVTVYSPQQTERETVVLSGDTERVSKVTIDELEVPITEDGGFTVERAYPPGYTVVIVEAHDRFGRNHVETLTFITPEIHASEKEDDSEENSVEDDS